MWDLLLSLSGYNVFHSVALASVFVRYSLCSGVSDYYRRQPQVKRFGGFDKPQIIDNYVSGI